MACMWSMARLVSWQAEQAEVTGDFTRVVPCAAHGAAGVQVATRPVQVAAVVQVHGAAAVQFTAGVPWAKVTSTPWMVTGPFTSMVQGLAAVQAHGAAGVQATPP